MEEVVLSTKLLKDLAKLTGFCHTVKIEVYHYMMLKYCSKQEHFSYKGMVARTQLATLDNNANAERPQAVVQSGGLLVKKGTRLASQRLTNVGL